MSELHVENAKPFSSGVCGRWRLSVTPIIQLGSSSHMRNCSRRLGLMLERRVRMVTGMGMVTVGMGAS